MIGCQGQWRAGRMNRINFQPDGTQMYPIFPGPDRVYEVLVLANGFQISHQKQLFILESHQGGPSFQMLKNYLRVFVSWWRKCFSTK